MSTSKLPPIESVARDFVRQVLQIHLDGMREGITWNDETAITALVVLDYVERDKSDRRCGRLTEEAVAKILKAAIDAGVAVLLGKVDVETPKIEEPCYRSDEPWARLIEQYDGMLGYRGR